MPRTTDVVRGFFCGLSHALAATVSRASFFRRNGRRKAFLVGGKSGGYWLFAATLYIEFRQPAKVNVFSLCPPMLSRLFARNGLSRENTRETAPLRDGVVHHECRRTARRLGNIQTGSQTIAHASPQSTKVSIHHSVDALTSPLT